MVPYIKKISLITISLLICDPPFRVLLQLTTYCAFIVFIVFMQNALTHFVSEWSLCTFVNMLASNDAIKLVNTVTSTCVSILDK